jgi:hypothetical protein
VTETGVVFSIEAAFSMVYGSELDERDLRLDKIQTCLVHQGLIQGHLMNEDFMATQKGHSTLFYPYFHASNPSQAVFLMLLIKPVSEASRPCSVFQWKQDAVLASAGEHEVCRNLEHAAHSQASPHI